MNDKYYNIFCVTETSSAHVAKGSKKRIQQQTKPLRQLHLK